MGSRTLKVRQVQALDWTEAGRNGILQPGKWHLARGGGASTCFFGVALCGQWCLQLKPTTWKEGWHACLLVLAQPTLQVGGQSRHWLHAAHAACPSRLAPPSPLAINPSAEASLHLLARPRPLPDSYPSTTLGTGTGGGDQHWHHWLPPTTSLREPPSSEPLPYGQQADGALQPLLEAHVHAYSVLLHPQAADPAPGLSHYPRHCHHAAATSAVPLQQPVARFPSWSCHSCDGLPVLRSAPQPLGWQ